MLEARGAVGRGVTANGPRPPAQAWDRRALVDGRPPWYQALMDAWAHHFVELWRANRELIGVTIVEHIRSNPFLPVKYALPDVHQMFDGSLAMMIEKLEGKETIAWDTYMDSVIPAFYGQGATISGLVGQITANAMILYNILVPRAAEEHRQNIADFLARWFIEVNMTVIKIGIDAGVKS
ncbi:hypothetical protein [Polyangium sp. 6x1]|uniref:hypothetical protein n=1 Tax=Polyangium sp. 6x1 TaxID=3042689 RepID=UPI0024828871|nr:hypothetical protein [Polyangium sp. 6x1]MDI1443203.1 hypothetical protein [Polyangium sp. 6x1]